MKFLLRGWLPILLGVVVGVLAGLALQKAQTPTYLSSTSVLVQDPGVSNTTTVTGARTASAVNLDTESNLVTSTAVVSETRRLLRSRDSLTTIAARITVSVPPNSNLLKIMYSAGTPKAAQAGSAAVADAYLKNRGDTAKAYLAAQVKLLQTNYDSTNKALTKATADVLKYKSDSQDGQLAAASKSLLGKKLSALSQQLVTDQGIVVTPGSISQSATLGKPSGLSKTLFLASGLALGLLLGLLGAWLLARRPVRKLRKPEQVQASIGLPVIARIDGLEYGELASIGTPAAEAYRRLVNVMTASLSANGGIVLIAGADETQMGSTVTHNIAATISRSGEHVAVLRTRADAQDAANTEKSAPPYRILPSTGPRTRLAIENLREHEDGYVLIDTPGPLRNADAQSYGTTVDAVIIVIRARTSAEHLRKVLAEFDAVAAPVLGTVLVRTARRGTRTTGGERQLENTATGSGDSAADLTADVNADADPVATNDDGGADRD